MNRKEVLLKIKERLKKGKQQKDFNDTFQNLVQNENFILQLLEISANDIDVFCAMLGYIYTRFIVTREIRADLQLEELLKDIPYVENYKERVIENGVFTHSCNGSMIDAIKQNGLGSKQNKNEQLWAALEFLEQKLGTTGNYTKYQTNRVDEVYFSAPGATTFGYACHFAPERLFLGILEQTPENNIKVIMGETKKDYYRRVLYSKFDILEDETKKNIEIVLDGFFSKPNYVVSFPISSIINSPNIYFEKVDEEHRISLKEFIDNNCAYQDYTNFFTTSVGSNSNPNNMDNFVMIDTVIPPEQLGIIAVPDYFDLIEYIAKNKNILPGEEFDYFTVEKEVRKI